MILLFVFAASFGGRSLFADDLSFFAHCPLSKPTTDRKPDAYTNRLISGLSVGQGIFCNLLVLLLASKYIILITAIDVEFDRIQCDQSLPAYAEDGDVFMTCNDGSSTRCTFGQDVMIRGICKFHRRFLS